MNGSVDTHADTKGQGINSAWLEELKMNHARRQFSQGMCISLPSIILHNIVFNIYRLLISNHYV